MTFARALFQCVSVNTYANSKHLLTQRVKHMFVRARVMAGGKRVVAREFQLCLMSPLR